MQKLQRVVDKVSLPMWMPGHCLGTTPILVRGPSLPLVGAQATPTLRVEVYTGMSRKWLPLYETVQALGYHHLGDLYTPDHQIIRERALKERDPTRKGIPSIRVWLACHNASTPSAGAPDEVASSTQGLDATCSAGVPRGSGRRRTCCQDHQGGDRRPERACPTGLHGYEGKHGGRALGTGTSGVLKVP